MRHMTRCLFTVVSFLAGFSGAAGAVQSETVGVWQPVSYSRYSAEENQTTVPFGTNPAGYLIYTESGYMSIVVTGEGRPAVSPTPQLAKSPGQQVASLGEVPFIG
jgi:hypothetical protein